MKKSGKITDDEQMKKLVKGEYCVNKLNIFLILDFVNAVGWLGTSDYRVWEEWNS